jgi:uncharacterized protein (DUF1800 family)
MTTMARDPQAARVALNRFGFGTRGAASGDLAAAANDPRGFVTAELAKPNVALLDAPSLQDTPALAEVLFEYRQEVKQKREAQQAAAKAAGDTETAMAKPDAAASAPTAANAMMAPADAMQKPQAAKPPQQEPNIIQQTFRAEALARLQRACLAEVGLAERLVVFWSNHFCISASKGQPARIWAGAFEREAIRPHVLGRFSDMLLAVEQHPAMLFFLDNQQSIGPDSRAGQNRKRGLNENLAREIMELHTLGVGGGYTQEDVTSLARIITGWTYAGREGKLGRPGTFVFNINAHEPGAQTLLRKSYPDGGVEQGEAALRDIARHPSTAKFIATKFARHFVADDPPPALVERLAKTFTTTDGDLRALTLALLDADEAWQAPVTKMRTPYEFVVASARLLDRTPEEPSRALGALNLLGQPLWTPGGPNGFADTSAAWASPEGMKLRLDIASQIASKLADTVDARELVDVVAGPAASQETRQAVSRAESRQQALALLLMSPEFQRR